MTLRNQTAILFATLMAAAGLQAHAGGHAAAAESLAQARISAADAVRAATAHVQGRATDVDFEHGHGQHHYKVEVKAGGQEYEIRIDAANGRVIDSRAEPDDDHRKARAQPAVTLERALAVALARTGGQVKDAGLDYTHGRPVYEVETVAKGQKYEVKVDGQSGKVISSRMDQ